MAFACDYRIIAVLLYILLLKKSRSNLHLYDITYPFNTLLHEIFSTR